MGAPELCQRDIKSLSEYEIGEIVDRYKPSIEFTPNFENFWENLKGRKESRRQGCRPAKKESALQPSWVLQYQQVKALIKPLLKRVVQTAIGKLPVQLQPMAKKLAERLPLKN